MLNELNKIAAGLLGLHGYPTQPWTPPVQDAANGRGTTPAGGDSRSGKTYKRASRPRRPGPATRAWR